MRLLAIALFALLTVVAVSACGGDNDESVPSPTPEVVPGGVFPRHLTAVSPAHESTVTNAEIDPQSPDTTNHICASFDFRAGETMGDDPTSRVGMVINEENITDSAAWVVTDDLPTSSGTLCYAPPGGLEGLQTVVLRWSDATDRQFVYSWQFTVAD